MKARVDEAETLRRCQHECQSRCCRYITMVINAPKRKCDFDELSWFLAHENISVYVESRRWHLEVQNPCKHLGSDNLCQIYETRPGVCREYESDSCEYPVRPVHSLQFDTQEALESWRAEREAAKRERQRGRQMKAAP